MNLGAAAVSDAELVAIQLGSGSRGETASVLAARLLADFEGVLRRHRGRGLTRAPWPTGCGARDIEAVDVVGIATDYCVR